MKLPTHIPAFIWRFVKRQPIAFSIAFVTALIWAVNEVLFPYFIKLFINAISNYHGAPVGVYTVLMWPLTALIVCWVVMEISMRVQGITLITAFPRFRANIREMAFNYIKQHSHEYFANNFAGSIAQKLSSLPTSSQTVVEIMLFTLCSVSVGFSIAVGLMWMASPFFAGILIAWFVVHMSVTLLFLRSGSNRLQAHAESVTKLSGKMIDSITNITSVRLFARGGYESDYLKQAQADEFQKATRAFWHIETMRLIQGCAGLMLIFSMIFTLIHGWVQGWVTLGDFSLIGMLTFWVLGMIWYMSYQLGVLVRELSTIKEALSLIAVEHGISDSADAKPLVVAHGEVRFDDVVFAYQKKHLVFNHLNVHIPAGKKVGLVGFSGSGKSTFVNLILRLYELTDGQILIDGQDIARVTQDSLRANIAMIPQEPSLFHRTLMENIRYGRLEATDEEVIEASKLAHCHEFIEKLSEGYESLVGERGIKLSGGQRQRIAIARAILKNAPILILDEATSSLDSVTEKLIQESLSYLMQNRTTIVIAHVCQPWPIWIKF